MKVTYKNALIYLSEFSKMNKSEREQFEKKHNISYQKELERIRKFCYNIKGLRNLEIKALHKYLKTVSDEECKAIERINNMTFAEIQDYLDAQVKEIQEETKRKRAFGKAWNVRKAEVLKQLVEEGVMKHEGEGLGSYYHGDFVTIMRRLDNARIELAKEMNASTY